MKIILHLLLAYHLVACLSAIESPAYTVVKKIDDQTEIRTYDATKWVSTSASDLCQSMSSKQNSMFMTLFGYISGKNAQNRKIEMTAPVLTQLRNLDSSRLIDSSSTCNLTMNFYVPKANQANVPKPTNPDAFLQDMGQITVAAIRFGWYPDMNDYMSNRDKLIEKLGAEASQYDKVNMMVAGYDSPWKFWNRRNEVLLLKL